jgi:long-chain fatty acid transport protein
VNLKRVLTTTLAVALSAAICSPAFATNGYFTHGTGTKNKGMAGAGLAMPEGSIAIANNPAAALVGVGQLDVGAALFSPLRSYSSSTSLANGNGGAFTIGPNDIDSDRNYFVIPHVAYGWSLSPESAIGVAFYGRGGMNTKWQGGTASFDPDGPAGPAPVMTLDGTFGGGKAGVDLSQAFLDVAYARKVSDNVVLGASLVGVVQSFEAYGVSTFAGFTQTFADGIFANGVPGNPTNLSDNGHEFSTGFGAKIGIQANLSDTVSFAAMYQTEIGMSELDTYADLFAESGGFDIPANAKIGVTFQASDTLKLSLDAEQIWYSDVASVGNAFSNIFTCPTANSFATNFTTGCLGGSNGAGFGWDDMTVYKIGAEWNTGTDWTWRAGYSHGSQPIPSSEVMFNILAPAVIEDHVAGGFTKKNPNGSEWNFAAMYAFKGDQSGPNPLDPTQTLKIEMYQWELELSYSWRF